MNEKVMINEAHLEHLVNKAVNEVKDKLQLSIYLEDTKFLYHATPSCYVSSIKKYGLGGKIPQTRFWNYEGTPYENIKQGVFLARDEYVAESYVDCSEEFEELSDKYEEKYDKELEIVVFAVSVKDLDVNLLSIDQNQYAVEKNDMTFFYNGVIPYNKLKKVKLY